MILWTSLLAQSHDMMDEPYHLRDADTGGLTGPTSMNSLCGQFQSAEIWATVAHVLVFRAR